MQDVSKIYITQEVSQMLDLNPSYLIRVAKRLAKEEKLSGNDFRAAGKRTYLYNEKAINIIKRSLIN